MGNMVITYLRGGNRRIERIEINQIWERKGNKRCWLMYVVEV